MKIFLRYLALPVITACIVTAGVVIFYYLDASRNTDATAPFQKASILRKSTSISEANAAGEVIPIVYEDFVYPVDDTRDPFQKAPVPVDVQQPSGDTLPPIMLTGVIWDNEDPVAIIMDSNNNSYLVRTGEEISRGKILAIQPRSITVERDGKTQELVLWPPKM